MANCQARLIGSFYARAAIGSGLREFDNPALSCRTSATYVQSMAELPAKLVRDVRTGVRALRKTPAFTLGAIVTIALTVGATTAIFSVVHAVLLRQMPYAGVDRVRWIWSNQPGRDRNPFNVPDFIDYRDRARTLAGLAGFYVHGASLGDGGTGERVQGLRATGNL